MMIEEAKDGELGDESVEINADSLKPKTVSYTHLTLPTIRSV